MLASRADGALGVTGDRSADDPAVSADGRFVAFTTDSTNLDSVSNDAVSDVFIRDVANNTTKLVSRATGVAGAVGNGDSGDPSISADGRYVAFRSKATNFNRAAQFADSNQVYVRDLVNNTTTLVSRASGATGAVRDTDSDEPSISANGRYVAFKSFARSLDPTVVDDDFSDIYVRDLVDNTTTLASRATGSNGSPGNQGSLSPSISSDGTRVAFEAFVTNFNPIRPPANLNVYVRNVTAKTTVMASRGTGVAGTLASSQSRDASLSGNGRFVAFTTKAGAFDPNFSGPTYDTVYVRDLQANTTIVASRADGPNGAATNSYSANPSLSTDGRFVAFVSAATNLVAGSLTVELNAYVRDLATHTNVMVSRRNGPSGDPTNGNSASALIAGSGRYVVFTSQATNIDPAATSGRANQYRRDLLGRTPPATVVIGDASGLEGSAGTNRVFKFGVTLYGAPADSVGVDYATVNGTAVAPSDYTAKTGRLVFAAGETYKSVQVTVIGDGVREPNETFSVVLTAPTRLTLADGTGVGTILTDERTP